MEFKGGNDGNFSICTHETHEKTRIRTGVGSLFIRLQTEHTICSLYKFIAWYGHDLLIRTIFLISTDGHIARGFSHLVDAIRAGASRLALSGRSLLLLTAQ